MKNDHPGLLSWTSRASKKSWLLMRTKEAGKKTLKPRNQRELIKVIFSSKIGEFNN